MEKVWPLLDMAREISRETARQLENMVFGFRVSGENPGAVFEPGTVRLTGVKCNLRDPAGRRIARGLQRRFFMRRRGK